MKIALLRVRTMISMAGLFAAVLCPSSAFAQSELDVADAAAFMGDWILPLDTEFGAFDLDLKIEDQGGKVAASIGSPDLGGMQSITDITRSGETLVLNYEVDMQGQFIPLSLTLERDGDALKYLLETGAGEFSASGTGTRVGG